MFSKFHRNIAAFQGRSQTAGTAGPGAGFSRSPAAFRKGVVTDHRKRGKSAIRHPESSETFVSYMKISKTPFRKVPRRRMPYGSRGNGPGAPGGVGRLLGASRAGAARGPHGDAE